MPIFSSSQIPKTNDSSEFQRQCKILFECILDDPNVQEYGRSGQRQDGVDLFGRRKNAQKKPKVGIQCKQTTKSKLPATIVTEEANKALAFNPPLDEFIIVTTAEDDKNLQDAARNFTEEQSQKGRDFEVNVWGWKTISTKVLEHERAIKAFMPDYSPHIDSIIDGQSELRDVAKQSHLMLENLTRAHGISPPGSSSGVASLGSDTPITQDLDRRIDQYRDLILENNPKTAYRMLEALEAELTENVDNKIKYRIIANKAACDLRLNNLDKAATGFIEAYEICPDAPKADAHKVLGLTLKGNFEEALEFGTKCIPTTRDKVALFANLLIAKKEKEEEDQPFDFIPEELQDEADILIVKIDYLWKFQKRHQWREIAHYALSKYPDNDFFKRFAAEATLDHICEQIDSSDWDRFNEEIRDQINGVINTLRPQWDSRAQSESAWDDYHLSLTSNLTTAYRIVSDLRSAAQILDAVLVHVPSDPYLIERRFLTAAEQDDAEKIKELLPKLPITRDSALGLLQWINNSANWLLVRDVPPMEAIPDLNVADKAFYEVMSGIALYKLGEIEDIRKFTSDLATKYPEEVIVLIGFHQIALAEKDEFWANEIYQKALDKKGNLGQAGRLMLAHIAEIQEDLELVIELLKDNVDYKKDSMDLRTLGRAFVNTKVRKAAVEFINKLDQNLKELPYYSRIIASIHFNRGDLKEAENYFRNVLNKEPFNLYGHIGLINTLLRDDRKGAVKGHIQFVDFRKLDGPEIYKMQFAQIMVFFDRAKEGVEFAYRTTLDNYDDPNVLLLYIGLFLPSANGAPIPETDGKVQIDTCIEIQTDDGKHQNFYIEEGSERPSIGHIDPTHEVSKLLIGKTINDEVVKQPQYGVSENWKIVSIKHKYLALLHEITDSFSIKFPSHRGFYTCKTKEGDVTPILENIKQTSEKTNQIIEFCEKQNLPFAIAANMCGDHVWSVANHLIQRKGFIRSCLGNLPERNQALKICNLAFKKGVALDTYTAWEVQNLDLLPILKTLFPRLVIARSTLDELLEWKHHFESHGNQSFMTIKYENGKYYREEISPENICEIVASIENTINSFRSFFEIIPTESPDNPKDFEKQVLELGGSNILDCGYLAKNENLYLLSNDFNYMALLFSLYKLEGFWLQIPLFLGLNQGKIKIRDYTNAILSLVKMGHTHITLSAKILLEACRMNETGNLEEFKHLMTYIGTPNADFVSHMDVAEEFLKKIWLIFDVSDFMKSQATGITLERVMELSVRFGLFDDVFKELLTQAENIPKLEDYIHSWLRGHFIVLN